ncbi:MAG: hypothetical protein CL878_12880 [Dehalococcoidia bacterium]|nr:hypothetical protein [Dehalococcoidia bacterium]
MASDQAQAVTLTAAPGTAVLFTDLLEVAELRNAHLVVNEATKHPANPVLATGNLGEWDSMGASPWQGTVLWDAEDDHFKAWYMGIDAAEAGKQWPRMGYAVSPDGVAWEKPKLGLIEHNGSHDNNLIVDNTPLRTNGPCLKDPGDPDPARRYKLVLPNEDENKEIWNSPDGVRFTREGKACLTSKFNPDGSHTWLPDPEAWFDVHQVLYDAQDPDPQRRYKCYGQLSAPRAAHRGGWTSRKGGMAYGPDPWTWTRSPHNPIMDPDDGEEFQIHCISVLPWRGYYLLLYEFAWIEPLYGSYVGDVRLAVSRDGECFQRVNPHQPVIRRGDRGAWDSGFIVIASDVVAHRDEFRLYYSGQAEVWRNWPGENKRGWPRSAGSIFPAQMGLATLPIDGFTNVESRDREMPGTTTTIPISLGEAPTALEVNVGATLPGRSWVDAEVLGDDDKPLAGYRRDECAHIWSAGPRQQVRWRDQQLLPSDSGPYRLRFWTYGTAKLYGFTFVAA